MAYNGRCRHKNVVQLLAYSVDSAELCIVYELLVGGTLKDVLSEVWVI